MALLFLLVTLAGCESVAPKQDPQTIVRERAQAYLAAMEQGDYRAAHGYLSPGFRVRVAYEVYAARFIGRLEWLSGEVRSVACEEEICEVKVKQGYRLLHAPLPGFEDMGENEQFITQTWIFIEDQWWYRPNK